MKRRKLRAMGIMLSACLMASSMSFGTVALAEEPEVASESRLEDNTGGTGDQEDTQELPKAETPTAQFDAATGILSGVDENMKYSIDGGAVWTDITSATVDLSKAELDAQKDILVIRKGQADVSEDSEAQVLDLTKPDTPAAPVVASSTDTTITVTAVEGQEYAIGLSTDTAEPVWGTTVEFKDLKQNTVYLISTRIPAKGLALQSDVATLTVKTGVTPLAAPTGLKVSTVSASATKITWNAVAGASSYTLYRSTDNKEFTQVATVTELTYQDATGLQSGTTYYYRVSASKVVDGVSYSSSVSSSAKGRTRIEAPVIQITQKYKKNILTWNEVPNVQVYRVFRATSKNGTYTAIATVSEPTYTDTGRDMSKKYYYKVRGISQTGNKAYYGIHSSVKSSKKVMRPVVMLTETYGSKVRLTWSKVKYSDGIVVYRKLENTGKLKKIATYEDGRTKYASETLTKGDRYRYRVRSYRIINGKKVYGAYSKVQKVTVK